jgi:hypothetical protein
MQDAGMYYLSQRVCSGRFRLQSALDGHCCLPHAPASHELLTGEAFTRALCYTLRERGDAAGRAADSGSRAPSSMSASVDHVNRLYNIHPRWQHALSCIAAACGLERRRVHECCLEVSATPASLQHSRRRESRSHGVIQRPMHLGRRGVDKSSIAIATAWSSLTPPSLPHNTHPLLHSSICLVHLLTTHTHHIDSLCETPPS